MPACTRHLPQRKWTWIKWNTCFCPGCFSTNSSPQVPRSKTKWLIFSTACDIRVSCETLTVSKTSSNTLTREKSTYVSTHQHQLICYALKEHAISLSLPWSCITLWSRLTYLMTSKAPRDIPTCFSYQTSFKTYPMAELGFIRFLECAHVGAWDLRAVFCLPQVLFTCLIHHNLAVASLHIIPGWWHRSLRGTPTVSIIKIHHITSQCISLIQR